MSNAARQFMTTLRAALKVPIALSSFRFPNYHTDFPWSSFLEFCDLHMPQVYWEQAHNAGEQLRKSKRQCDALPNAKPTIPIGAAYDTPGWIPTAADIDDFLNTAKELGLPAISFFDWEACRAKLPVIWKVIADFAWPIHVKDSLPAPNSISTTETLPIIPPDTLHAPEPTTAQDISPTIMPDSLPAPDSFPTADKSPTIPMEVFLPLLLAALNNRNAAQAAQLYDPSAVQVWADQIVHGTEAIQASFDTFFTSLPSGTDFAIVDTHSKENELMFAWKAATLTGETMLVLQNGKIILDYTFIT